MILLCGFCYEHNIPLTCGQGIIEEKIHVSSLFYVQLSHLNDFLIFIIRAKVIDTVHALVGFTVWDLKWSISFVTVCHWIT
jgi:hypothetical protein